MSNLVPSTLRTSANTPAHPDSLLPDHLYTDCQSCRITGTVTFSAVGLYVLTVARSTAKTPVGKGAASLMGLGFLAVAAARWTAYTPPPVEASTAQPS